MSGIGYATGTILMLIAGIFAIAVCFMKYDSSARISVLDMTIKLRFFSLAFLFLGMLVPSLDVNEASVFLVSSILWVVVSVITLICKNSNPLKLPVAINIIFALAMYLLYLMLK